MKKASVVGIVAALVAFFFQTANAQQLSAIVPTIDIQVCSTRTAVLVFPATILGADRGSDQITTAIMKGAENILRVKASAESITPTNLTVYTADGRLYGFNVSFAFQPLTSIYNLAQLNRREIAAPVIIRPGVLNPAEVADVAAWVAGRKPQPTGPRDKAGRVRLSLRGVYIEKGVMFFQLSLSNRSRIPFDLDFARFYIKDGKQIKRVAELEVEKIPLYIHQADTGSIQPFETRSIVVAAEKFTVARGRHFRIELFERGGDRHLSIKLRQEHLMNALSYRPNEGLE